MEKLTYTNTRGESIKFDGSPFYLVSVGGLGDVGADVQRQKSPYQDGSTYIDTTLSERIIPIQFLIVGDDYADVSNKRIQLSRVMNPKLGEGKLVYDNGHVVREIRASAESVPFFPDGSGNRIDNMQKGLVTLVASNPYWRSTSITEEPMAAFVELFEFPSDEYWEVGEDGDLYFEVGFEGEKREFTIEGDAEVPIEITFDGPLLNPTLRNNTTGQMIRVNRRLNAGDKLFIDTNDSTVLLNDEDVFQWIDLNSDFWKLTTGKNEIEFFADEGVETAHLVLRWQERYVSV